MRPEGYLENADRAFAFIVDFKTKHDGTSPTLREIGDHIGVGSTSQVTYYLERLEKAGKIKRTRAAARVRIVAGKVKTTKPKKKIRIEVVGGEWRGP